MRISNLYFFDTGELDRALESAQLWAKEYPRDKRAHIDLALTYMELAQYQNAISELLEALQLDPDFTVACASLVKDYAFLNRLDEAKAVYQQALKRNLSDPDVH